jgi:pimeloyl-ACP methyl ester carboxylesterase
MASLLPSLAAFRYGLVALCFTLPTFASANSDPQWDNQSAGPWDSRFSLVEIPSSVDGSLQKAYLHRSAANGPQPLVVSLHTWSGNYAQEDPLSRLAAAAGFHYIHPDFRGPNRTPESCASPLALQDIDDAIAFALSELEVDRRRIYVVGTSGGGHATCSAYMRSQHDVRAFIAWVPITDLGAWYWQTKQRGLRYHRDILAAVGSSESFDEQEAQRRSPLFMPRQARTAPLHLFAGIEDGYKGSVPISHSILLFNRLCHELGSPESAVSPSEMVSLLTKATQPTEARIADRAIYFHRDIGAASLTIFAGGHEMLTGHCFEMIRTDALQAD